MIKLRSVYKAFDNHKVLDNLCLSFNTGSKTALVGPSGCGKTTLFRIIAGLEAPDSGEVIRDPDMRFSAVFQDDRLCENMTLYANLKLVCPPQTKKSELYSEAEKLGLSGFAGKTVSTFSGGMKRRACILRAMLAEFDTLVLDEPFNGLDSETKALCANYILDKLSGRTLIMITHNPEDIDLMGCDVYKLNSI